jgi:hypothetical protein
MLDLFDVLFAGYFQSKTSGLTALQSSSDQRITGATDRLAALEYRYERMIEWQPPKLRVVDYS